MSQSDWVLQVRAEIAELEAQRNSPDLKVRQKFHGKDDAATSIAAPTVSGADRARNLIGTLKDLLQRASKIHPGA